MRRSVGITYNNLAYGILSVNMVISKEKTQQIQEHKVIPFDQEEELSEW